jgi:hypothetical protein
MVVVLEDIAHPIDTCLPLMIGVVLNWVEHDGRVRGVRQALRAQEGEHHVSSLLHGIIHVVPNDPC